MEASRMMKALKNGMIGLKLSEELIEVLKQAINQAIWYDQDDLPEYLYFLLLEVQEKLHDSDGKLKLRKSEFFALFSSWSLRYIDDPTQVLMKEKIILPTLKIIQPLKVFQHENQIPLLG